MVSFGSLAMIVWKPGQAWKGAAVPKDSCAEMWLKLATQPYLERSVLILGLASKYLAALFTACDTFISICLRSDNGK